MTAFTQNRIQLKPVQNWISLVADPVRICDLVPNGSTYEGVHIWSRIIPVSNWSRVNRVYLYQGSGICRTMWDVKIVHCATWAESLIYLSDFSKILYKRSLFDAVLEGFYLFSNLSNLGGHMRTNNMCKINLEKKCPSCSRFDLQNFKFSASESSISRSVFIWTNIPCHIAKALQKLEYNGDFRAQLQVITFITSVKETLFYN